MLCIDKMKIYFYENLLSNNEEYYGQYALVVRLPSICTYMISVIY